MTSILANEEVIAREYQTELKPYRGRIMAVAVEAESQTPGGIIIPDSAQKQGEEHIIVAIGEGDFDEDGVQHPIKDLEVGQRIFINKYSGTILRYENPDGKYVEAIIVKPSEITAVFA
jgi:chaperonin GroES